MSELKCINCDNDIDDDEEEHFVEATIDSSSKFCHLKCFRCTICNDVLTGWYFEKDGQVYCRRDYHHKYGERCRNCCNVISGPVMVVGGEIKFHPECFKCSLCSAIIGDDESYACVQQCRLFCNLCFLNDSLHDEDSTWQQHKEGVNDRVAHNNANNHHEHHEDVSNGNNGIRTEKQLQPRQHCIRILPAPTTAAGEADVVCGRSRGIKLIVRDCHMNNKNARPSLNQHHTQNLSSTSSEFDTLTEPSLFLPSPVNSLHCRLANGHTHTVNGACGSNNMLQICDIDVKFDLDLYHIGGDRLVALNYIPVVNKSLSEIETILEESHNRIVNLSLEHRSHSALAAIKSDSNISNNNGSICNNHHPISNNLNHTTNESNSVILETSFDANSSFECESTNQSIREDSAKESHSSSQVNLSAHPLVLGKPPLRPNPGVLSTTSMLNGSVKSDDTLECQSKISTNVLNNNNGESFVRKSRANDKRNRNRERSSSLSRLLESIRLSSEASSVECCEANDLQLSQEDVLSSQSSEVQPHLPVNTSSTLPEKSIPIDSVTVTVTPKPNISKLSSSHSTRNGILSRLNNPLSRTKSFRVEPKSYRIFRAADLVKGSLLGKGSFGEVYEVTDKNTKEKMVLKELYHNDREAEANFVREVQILKSLNHKNVLHFIGILYRGRKLNLITEHITGGTLRELIQRESQSNCPIHWPERISWARDIASGMNYLHSMRIIHRDLNSQNCLVRNDGTVVVADFGLSKIICTDDNDENVNVADNPQMHKLIRRKDRRKRYTIVGNPFWMAPEMMQRNKYDERVDIYSFGIILLEIIGSVNADPDDLRRNRDFSVDKIYFLENFVQKSCPNIFWQIAFLCTEMNPDMRPPFPVQERWLQVIYNSLAYNNHNLSFRNLADSGTLFSDSAQMRDDTDDVITNYDKLLPQEIQIEVSNFNVSIVAAANGK